MRNHDEKVKDMAESVLPSTGRRSARELRRRAHRRHRARQRDLLIAIRDGYAAGCRDDADYYADDDADLRGAGGDVVDVDFAERRRSQDIDTMVWQRRFADKTGSLTRWAASRVDRDDDLRYAPVDEQRDHFARLLPDNLIGRHAVQHIESALEYRARRDDWRGRRAAQADRRDRERARFAADLRILLDAGCHQAFNEALRAGYLWQAGVRPCGAEPTRPRGAVGRLLLGRHDVDDFVADVAGRHPWIPDLARRLAAEAR